MTTKYEVTKMFVGGILEGITINEITTVKFDVGFRCEKPIGGSPYIITAVRPLGRQ